MTAINCDMGEAFGLYKMGDDAGLMPLIDVANVACGFHGSDFNHMRSTVQLAKKHGVKNLEYRLGDLEDPPVVKGSVDLVLLSQALHHALKPERAIQAAHRILKKNGRVVVLDLLSHRFEKARELYADRWLGFSEVKLHELLEKGGFHDIEVNVVSREKQNPQFQTVFATGVK